MLKRIIRFFVETKWLWISMIITIAIFYPFLRYVLYPLVTGVQP